MITIFAIPKPFEGQFRVIQLNAITSWTHLRPPAEIILFGDDAGTAEVASRLGLRHEPDVTRNDYGTPLMDSVFGRGQALARQPIVSYVNADIILMSDFMRAVQRVLNLMKGSPFVMVGRKKTVELNTLLNFADEHWERDLGERVQSTGTYVTYDSDFFVFPRGLFQQIPPFAIGRCFWTQWLIFEATRRQIPVIDATAALVAVESRHDYSHVRSTGGAKRLSGVEFRFNRRLFRGCKYFTTVDASHRLEQSGLQRTPAWNRLLSLGVRAEYAVYFLLKSDLYPYSLPIIAALRLAMLVKAKAIALPRSLRRLFFQ